MKERKKEILISANQFESRVAIVEGGRLSEFYIERARDRGITGNVYKGKVVRVLPGMQSAFVEVGLARTAFLHVTDIKESLEGLEEASDREEEEKEKEREKRHGPHKIQDMLKEGQEIMVQVAKEPIGTKGARVTSYISLAGRYLVFMPTYGKVAISRRISSEKERRRLRDIVFSIRQSGHGYIIRTVCDGMKREDVKSDMEFLIKLWQRIQQAREKAPTPSIIYEELDLSLRTIRDSLGADVEKVLIDSPEEYERVMLFVREYMPELAGAISLYSGPADMFDANGIEIELPAALEKRVWLRSGGYIIIDQMEALTAIDVNTGKYVGRRSSDETILKTNLEAVTEVVHQLRLRNIGGIIVIDFIDMARSSDREKVYNELKEALRADKAQTNILKISELGIVEMTRKRVRESLVQSFCEPCPYCDGNAVVKSKDSVIMDIYRDLVRLLPQKPRKVEVFASPAIAERLVEERHLIEGLEKKYQKKVEVTPVDRFSHERYEIQ